jgi:hypothetical protein
MLRYVFGHDEAVAKFVAQLIPHNAGRDFGRVKTIGVIDEDGLLIAGIVYGNWDPGAGVIEIAAAAISPRWLTRRTLQVMYRYPFDQCGCQMVVQRTPADNERLLRQLAVGGYNFYLVPRLFGRDRDAVICTLTKETWASSRFIRRRYATPHEEIERAA